MKPPLLRRWADPAWWRYVRYTYPERLIVCGGLVAVALAFGGFVTVSALGSGGASAAAPPAQKSPFGTTGGRTAQAASTAAGVRSLPHSSLRGPASVTHGGSGTSHATSGSAPSGTSQARGGQRGSGASAPTQAVAGTATTAGHGTTTPTATTAGTTPAAGTTTAPAGTTVAVTTPVVTVTVPLP